MKSDMNREKSSDPGYIDAFRKYISVRINHRSFKLAALGYMHVYLDHNKLKMTDIRDILQDCYLKMTDVIPPVFMSTEENSMETSKVDGWMNLFIRNHIRNLSRKRNDPGSDLRFDDYHLNNLTEEESEIVNYEEMKACIESGTLITKTDLRILVIIETEELSTKEIHLKYDIPLSTISNGKGRLKSRAEECKKIIDKQ
jgi:superfamily I DNA/RNA helicase